MEAIHRLIAFLAVGATVVGIGWSLLLVATGRPSGPGYERFQAGVVSVFLIGAVSGGLLLFSGYRPVEALHLLYAVIALAVVPLARSFLGRTAPRRAAVLLLVAFVVLGAVTYRLFTTG